VPATVVGTPGAELVTGTAGPDVVVTNGAVRVNALGGDDLVCVTGDVSAAPDASRAVVVLAGDGDDRVEATTPGWGTLALLGAGADAYVGSSGADQEVRTADVPFAADDAVDTVRVTSGIATVYSGSDSRPNGDVIEIDAGTVQWTGFMTPAGRLTGGPGSALRTVSRSGDARIDAVRRTAVTEASSATYDGFTAQEFATSAYKGTLRFRGTHDVDDLRVEARDTYDRIIDLRGGADWYATNGFGNGRSTYDGGAGRDHLLLAVHRREVDADLGTGRFVAREGKRIVRRTFEDFEDLVLASKEATVHGTPSGEEIIVLACRASVSAAGGRDRVRLNGVLTDWDNPGCPSRHGLIDGGRGDDVLSGSTGRDRIVGGPGHDIADGREGRDTCLAEKTTSCEVRR
jgi:hypothetical protein